MERDWKMQYFISACVSLATVTTGMTSAWSTVVLPKFHDNETRVDIDKDGIAWMLAMASPGFVSGSLLAGYTVDKFGRRATMLWSALPYSAGMITVATAVKPWQLFITPFLWSSAISMLNTSLIMYCMEVFGRDTRNRLFLSTKITFHVGYLFMMCVGPNISYSTLNYGLLVMPFSYLLTTFWIPESPYFLLKEGDVDGARNVLLKLRGNKTEAKAISLEDELLDMQEHVKCEMRRSSSPKELFGAKQYRKAIVIATGMKSIQILMGASTIQKYLGLILLQSRLNIKLWTLFILVSVEGFISSIMASYLVDRVRRRPLLICSYIGTGISLTVVGMYFFFMEIIKVDQASLTPYGSITFAGIMCSNIISTMGHKSLTQVIPGEIFPLNVKAVAMTSLNILSGCLGFVMTRSYQALEDQIGLTGVFWIFAATAFCGSIFSYIFIPETKGMSLKEIQKLLQGDLYEDNQSNGIANDGYLDENKKQSNVIATVDNLCENKKQLNVIVNYDDLCENKEQLNVIANDSNLYENKEQSNVITNYGDLYENKEQSNVIANNSNLYENKEQSNVITNDSNLYENKEQSNVIANDSNLYENKEQSNVITNYGDLYENKEQSNVIANDSNLYENKEQSNVITNYGDLYENKEQSNVIANDSNLYENKEQSNVITNYGDLYESKEQSNVLR